MLHWIPLIAGLLVSLTCAYQRVGLRAWTIATAVAIVGSGLLAGSHWLAIALPLLVFAAITLPLNLPAFRRARLSAPLLAIYRKITPKLSPTEQIALEAGTVGFEGQLFSGKPDWSELLAQPRPELSIEEQAFLDGPVEQLCSQINDWQITHELADLPEEMWKFIKDNRFFGMIIPKQYGGLQFSALAHSAVLQKIASMSATVSSRISVLRFSG